MTKKPEPGQPILVEIGGQLLELKFPLRILKELDRDQGISIFRGQDIASALTDPAKLAVMFFYGLKTKQEWITPEWVEDNIDASMLLSLAPYLAYAASGRWPKIGGDEEDTALPNAERVSGSHGSPYGPVDDTISDSVNTSSGT